MGIIPDMVWPMNGRSSVGFRPSSDQGPANDGSQEHPRQLVIKHTQIKRGYNANSLKVGPISVVVRDSLLNNVIELCIGRICEVATDSRIVAYVH